jgi:hypothetical protein
VIEVQLFQKLLVITSCIFIVQIMYIMHVDRSLASPTRVQSPHSSRVKAHPRVSDRLQHCMAVIIFRQIRTTTDELSLDLVRFHELPAISSSRRW